MRCFEQIRVDVSWNNLPVKIIGIGAGMSYFSLGPTHHAIEDIALMRSLPGITVLSPADNTAASAFARLSYELNEPSYIRLDRVGEPLVYTKNEDDFSDGLSVLKTGRDLWLIATGGMVSTAQQVAQELSNHSIDAGVIDLYRIKPLNTELLLKAIGNTRYIATLEENSIIAGIGSIVAEVLAESGRTFLFKRLGLPDRFCGQYGPREHLLALYDLDANGVTGTILKWMRA
jgi:transketolase